ncbi:MAG: hypothetical protein B6I19_11295 [Bacteroidetes bacterium 4572_114]|nr:MAG: hypothetical protein B6I19_11295 [Bacteroidetes bacterium 4572_114]
MKTLKKFIAVAAFVLAVSALSAQTPPPPNNGGGGSAQDPGAGNTPVGGGAPIGSGLLLLVGLGAAYGGKKAYMLYQEKKDSLVG